MTTKEKMIDKIYEVIADKKGNNTKHGMTGTSLFNIWCSLRQRCDNKNNKSYNNYGGRGISYDRKRKMFDNFYEDMGGRYFEGATIDRIDNNGNYCKDNCRWLSIKEQQNNRSNNIFIGEHNLRKYCEDNGLHYGTIWSRIKRGWSVEKSINTPIRFRTKKYTNE